MIRRSAQRRRRAALLVEAAFVYPLVITLILMIIIGGMGVFRYQQVACLAREAARFAAVHGNDWHKETGQTCPTKNDILQQAVLPMAVGMSPSNITLQVLWIQEYTGNVMDWDTVSKNPLSVTPVNQGVTNRVRVTVTYQWTPQLLFVGSINMQSTCEMPMSF